MSSNIVWPQVDGCVDPLLQGALERLDTAEELVVDFSAVKKLDPAALQALEQLASKASQKSAKVMLRGVNEQVYRVLKLLHLTARFSFLT